jgi:hypothetical protein
MKSIQSSIAKMPSAASGRIKPQKALYIKLGLSGEWERDCIMRDHTLRLGYREVSHDLCMNGKWEDVVEELKPIRKDAGAATRDKNQIQNFYEADEKVLWVTFFSDRLYWCFSTPQITFLPDRTKTRSVIGQWRATDLSGKPLEKSRLSGKLLSMQGFRGTICSVGEFEYLIRKINGDISKAYQEATDALSALEQKIETLIRSLHWKDFEILVDLIFRQAGWQRAGNVGGTEKTLDLDLISPITAERFAVQVKSRAKLSEFNSYQIKFEDMLGYRRAYFVVHTPSQDLIEAEDQATDEFQLWLPKHVAVLAVKYGLADWIIGKAA